MSPDYLRTVLESADTPPSRALRLQSDQIVSLIPELIELMDKASQGVFLTPRRQRLLRRGLFALAAVPCPGLFVPLMRLLRSPHKGAAQIFGETCGLAYLPNIVLAVFDGDVPAFCAAIEDPAADGDVRWYLFDSFARLVFDGRIGREAAVALVERFDDKRLAEDDDAAWEGWQDVVRLLGLEEQADRVRASWRNGRNWQPEVEQGEWEEALARALAEPDDPGRFNELDLEPLHAAAVALESFHYDRKVERLDGDPAAGVELDGDELAWLAGFLASVQVPETAMALEELDGFFTALIAGPASVPPSLYMPEVWGPDGSGPVYDGEEQTRYVADILHRHWRSILLRLEGCFPCPPMVGGDADWPPGRLWSEGFERGVELCIEDWEFALEDGGIADMLDVISTLRDDPDLMTELDDLAERDDHLSASMLAIHALHAYWHPQDEPTAPRQSKIGRNTPCPCGSGRKFKRCCGSATASMALH